MAPLADMAKARRLLMQLAGILDGDRGIADLDRALIRMPGTRNVSVYPAHDVRVEMWEPEHAYTVEQIESGLSASRKGG
jgi:hypothetical protein